MGGTCSAHGREDAYAGFWLGSLRERDHLGDRDVDVRKILRWIFRKWDVGGMELIEQAQERDSWRSLVSK
jgi:hypothetical protein